MIVPLIIYRDMQKLVYQIYIGNQILFFNSMINVKKLYLVFFFILINIFLFSDHLDSIFQSNYNIVKINKEINNFNVETFGKSYKIYNKYIIFKIKNMNTDYLIIKNIINNEINLKLNILPVNTINYYDEIFVNDYQDKFIYSILVSDPKINGIYFFNRFLFDIKNMNIEKMKLLNDSTDFQTIIYWKDDKIYYPNLGPKRDKNKFSNIFINLNMQNIGLYQVEYLFDEGGTVIDEIDSKDQLNKLFNKCIFISSMDYGFYTKPVFYDIKSGVYRYSLFYYDGSSIKELRLSGVEKDEIFEINKLENSSQDYEYLLVFGKKYKKNEFKEIINYMALIRKRDLQVKFYELRNNDLSNIDIKFGQYIVNKKSIEIINSQEDKSFITLDFEYDKKLTAKKEPIKTKQYQTTVNLRLRESFTTTSKIITTLPQGTKVEVLEIGNAETINHIKGYWVKVKTEKGETGWCFDGYLE